MSTSTRWCFTYNNYPEDAIENILKWDVRYVIVASEVGENNTPHLQGFVIFKKNYRLSGVRKLLSCHWEITKGTSQQASDYCKKDGDYHEVGVLSQQGKRTDLDLVADMIKDGKSSNDIFEEHPTTYMKFYRGINDAIIRVQEPYTHTQTRGVWIWGPPGTGKSHSARNFDDDLYVKPQSKWWDGYNGQSTVLLDDLDTSVLGHYLKIWTDKWSCTGETKGGTVHLRHKMFIVTSNYSIEELWPNDINMQRAIARRFRVFHKTERSDIISFVERV